jgi:hypothetical protein
MPDNKPITATEAVEAYNVLRKFCTLEFYCKECPFDKACDRIWMPGKPPEDWPDIKEAPHA